MLSFVTILSETQHPLRTSGSVSTELRQLCIYRYNKTVHWFLFHVQIHNAHSIKSNDSRWLLKHHEARTWNKMIKWSLYRVWHVVDCFNYHLLQFLHFVRWGLIQTLLHILQEPSMWWHCLALTESPHEIQHPAGGRRLLVARSLAPWQPAVGVRGGRGGRRGGTGRGVLRVWRSGRRRGFEALWRNAHLGSTLIGGVVLQEWERGLAVLELGAGLLRFTEALRPLVLIAGLAEEQQLAVMLPLWKVKVLRTTRFIWAHSLVLALEDGSQVPELCLYVFH